MDREGPFIKKIASNEKRKREQHFPTVLWKGSVTGPEACALHSPSGHTARALEHRAIPCFIYQACEYSMCLDLWSLLKMMNNIVKTGSYIEHLILLR